MSTAVAAVAQRVEASQSSMRHISTYTPAPPNRWREPHRRSSSGLGCVQQQMTLLWAALMWRVLVAVMVTPVMGQASATATSSSTFFSALTNPEVTLILIPPDNFQLIPEDWSKFNRSNPYVLDRDLVIRSSEPPELGQMDFQFLMRKVLLAPNVTVRLDQLVLRNVNKLGGFGLDFFMGDRGSVIDSSNSVRVKFVCPPPEQSIQAAQAFSAPEGFPANEVSIVDGVCVLQNRSNKQQLLERKCYDDAIHFSEFTLQVGSVDPDAGTAQPGYRLVMHNITRVCDYYVTAECIEQQSEDMCTAQLLSKLLAPEQTAHTSWQPQTIAGVVVGGVVGFLAVCCLAGVLLWKHRHWWAKGNGGAKDSDTDEPDKDPLVGAGSTRRLQQQLLPAGQGGKEPDPSKAVRLGQLLGSGSFGRVFKGRWHGMDVAVKIMDSCTAETLPRVLKEAEVMMGLEHHNIVKAFQCSVWSKKQQEEMMKAAAQRKIAEASSPRKGAQRKPSGRRSSGSASLPSSSTTASQAASSTSAAGSLQHPPAAPSTGAGSDNIVINIIPEFVPRSARPGRVAAAAAAAAGAGGPMSVGTATSSSSNAAGTLSSSSTSHGAGAPHSGEAGSSASTARRMFTRLWKYQQQEVPEHMLQGPSTASGSQERQLRTGVTPLSSAAYTLSGSSSTGPVGTGTSGHASAGVISSTQLPGAYGGAAAPSHGGQTVSSSSTGAGTSGALSSHGLTVSSGGHSSASAEIQPAPAKQAKGWLRRSSRQGRDVADVVPGSDSGSSKPGSPAVPAKVESDSQPDRDDLQVWLVLELCTGGSLKDAVTCGRIRTSSCQDMAKLLSRLLDAANGLAYLHKQGVVHGDLKAANVLLQHAPQGSYGQIAKVSDFGVSARLLDGATHRSTTSLGTITHMAPEVLRSGRLSKAADIYAYGIMMWEVFTNQTAHAGCHSGAVVERVVLRGERPPVPNSMPPQYALLMQRCWDEDAAKRPTFEQVIACLELLLDNLTSSDSEGRISEGVEEERTSSSNSDTGVDADKAAAAEPAAAASAAVKVSGEEVLTSGTPQGLTTGTPSASSSGRTGLLRFLSKGSSVGIGEGQASGKGLAESVEGSSDWLSGPGTPGFNIQLEQLQGLRQWYMAHAPALQQAAVTEADVEAQCEPAAVQYTPGYRTSRLQPWLDQCVDALNPASQGKQGADNHQWLYSRRWLLLGAGKLRNAIVGQGSTNSSLSQQPMTPQQSGSQLV